MKHGSRRFAGYFAVLIVAVCVSSCAGVSVPKPRKDQPPVVPTRALEMLSDGNARFVKNRIASKPLPSTQRANLAGDQCPFAIIVGCADSRTSPEIVFDQPLGALFVVRAAGNLVESCGMGSIEYAVEHLGSRLVVVLGHQRCGAVAAAVKGGHAPGQIATLIEKIEPAVNATGGLPGDAVENAMIENARRVAAQIRNSKPGLKFMAHGEKVAVRAARYDLDSGKVTWLE